MKSALKKSGSGKDKGVKTAGVRFNPEVEVGVFDKTLSKERGNDIEDDRAERVVRTSTSTDSLSPEFLKKLPELKTLNSEDKDTRGRSNTRVRLGRIDDPDVLAENSASAVVKARDKAIKFSRTEDLPLDKEGDYIPDLPDPKAIKAIYDHYRIASTAKKSWWENTLTYLSDRWKNVTNALNYVVDAVFSKRDNQSAPSKKPAGVKDLTVEIPLLKEDMLGAQTTTPKSRAEIDAASQKVATARQLLVNGIIPDYTPPRAKSTGEESKER